MNLLPGARAHCTNVRAHTHAPYCACQHHSCRQAYTEHKQALSRGVFGTPSHFIGGQAVAGTESAWGVAEWQVGLVDCEHVLWCPFLQNGIFLAHRDVSRSYRRNSSRWELRVPTWGKRRTWTTKNRAHEDAIATIVLIPVHVTATHRTML